MSGRTVPWALGTLALAVVVATAAFLLFGGGGGSASEATSLEAVVAPMGAPLASAAEALELERIRVSTSSTAPDSSPANLVDGDPGTTWISAVPEPGGSANETLLFRFTEPVVIDSVRFTTGSDSSNPAYRANSRIKTVQVTTDSDSQPVNLLDTGAEQEIEYRFGHTSKLTLEILDLYPAEGDAAPTAGVALAEVSFIARTP